MAQKLITKDYIDERFHAFRAEMHEMTNTFTANMEAFYELRTKHHTGGLKEGFKEEMKIAVDQVKSIYDKTNAHDARLCKLEELCYK
jgi:hypothetical protein